MKSRLARPFIFISALVALLGGCYAVFNFEDEDTDSSSSPSDGASDRHTDPDSDSGQSSDRSTETQSDGGDTVGDTSSTAVRLLVPPLVYAPTTSSFRVNAVIASGSRENAAFFFRPKGETAWTRLSEQTAEGDDVIEWHPQGLSSDTIYEYAITDTQEPSAAASLFEGRAVTARTSSEEVFSFALVTDAHIEVSNYAADTTDARALTLMQVGEDLATEPPDFTVHLGDQIDFHMFGFNKPPTDGSYTRRGYLNYRGFLGDVAGSNANFGIIGNWDGETGCFTDEEILRSLEQRLVYMPGPEPSTYKEGGSINEDYYAFTWGDALFVMLNVITYTSTCHTLSVGDSVDDWTLGEDQLSWLESTLAQATTKWKFLFIHHTVGGNGGDATNSAYGRGGGRAAYVGEQAKVHEMMLKYGVQIFFYGHDHVFMDMTVDGIHYTLPGSAGAPSNWMFGTSETGYPEGEYYALSGYARVEVGPAATQVEFLGLGNTALKNFTVEP